MERNYIKENAILIRRLAEAEQAAVMFQALYDDALERVDELEDELSDVKKSKK